jgi:hypothetical protein
MTSLNIYSILSLRQSLGSSRSDEDRGDADVDVVVVLGDAELSQFEHAKHVGREIDDMVAEIAVHGGLNNIEPVVNLDFDRSGRQLSERALSHLDRVDIKFSCFDRQRHVDGRSEESKCGVF